MANKIATVQNIARAVLPALAANLVFPNLCYTDFRDIEQKQGDEIVIPRPPKLIAQKFDPVAGVTRQDIEQPTVTLKLDNIATVDVGFEALERANSIEDIERLIGEPYAIALAEKINEDGLLMYKQVPNVIGTAGTTPTGISTIADARKALNKLKAPVSERSAVWNPDADGNFSQLSGLTNVASAGNSETLREGRIGRVAGFDNYMSQQVATHTQGTAISGNKTIVVAASASKGAKQIMVDSAAAAGTLKAGDVLKIGKYCYNVAEDVAAIGTSAAAVKLAQPLEANVADDAAITFPTYAEGKTSYAANLAFCRKAFAYVTRPLAKPAGVECYTTSYGGISLRVVRGYDMTYKRELMSIDVLYNYVCCYPELAVTVLG